VPFRSARCRCSSSGLLSTLKPVMMPLLYKYQGIWEFGKDRDRERKESLTCPCWFCVANSGGFRGGEGFWNLWCSLPLTSFNRSLYFLVAEYSRRAFLLLLFVLVVAVSEADYGLEVVVHTPFTDGYDFCWNMSGKGPALCSYSISCSAG